MRKCIVFALIICMMFGMPGCGSKDGTAAKVDIEDSISLLNTVWSGYAEEEKFPAAGGDFATEETTVSDGPGRFQTTDAAVWDYTLAVPESSVGKIDDAASLVHMMNANTFTCSAVHVKESGDAANVAKEIQENIRSRQWMCGQPDKMLVMTIGGYVISAYGEQSLMDTFKAKVLQAYPSADVLTEEAVIE